MDAWQEGLYSKVKEFTGESMMVSVTDGIILGVNQGEAYIIMKLLEGIKDE